MAETLLQKAQRLGIKPVVQPTESLIEKAQRLGIKPAIQTNGQNYFERVGSQFGRIGSELTTAINEGGEAYRRNAEQGKVFSATGSLLRSGLRAVGAVAEGAVTPIIEAPIIKQVTEGVARRAIDIPGAKDVISKATELAQKYPNQAKDLQNIIDIATLGGGRAVESPVVKEAKLIGRDVIEASRTLMTPTEQAVHKNVMELFSKSIKPSMKSVAKGERYENNVLNALKTIKSNADQLNITDIEGELVSRTPQTIQELSQALDQTKTLVFKQYDSLAKAAGKVGATIDAKPIANEVLQVVQNKALQITNPEVIKYAENWAERLNGLDIVDTETTQAVIQNLNANLKAFYQNPTYESASKAAVDAGIANNFRRALDGAIQNATGEQYQVLKNQYAALKAIEDDVIRAAARDARKNVKGLLDYSDIFTSGQMVGGILSMNAAMFTKGAIERGFKEYFKFLNDPNRAISNIFENLNIDTTKTFSPLSKTGQFLKNPKLGMSIDDVSKGNGMDKFQKKMSKMFAGPTAEEKLVQTQKQIKTLESLIDSKFEPLTMEKAIAGNPNNPPTKEMLKAYNEKLLKKHNASIEEHKTRLAELKKELQTISETGQFIKNPKLGMSIEDVSKEKYLYHGTSEQLLDSISKDGLKPMGRGALSLSKDESYARSFAESSRFPRKEGQGIMLRVKADAVKTTPSISGVPSDKLNELLTKQTISPKDIEIFKDGNWQPLKLDPLLSEARKYKSAEEFVNSPKYEYHLSTEPNLAEGKTFAEQSTKAASRNRGAMNSQDEGIFSTNNPQFWSSQLEYDLGKKAPQNVYLVEVKNSSPRGMLESGIDAQAVNAPQDIRIIKKLGTTKDLQDMGRIEALKKSQLTDIWKRANGKR